VLVSFRFFRYKRRIHLIFFESSFSAKFIYFRINCLKRYFQQNCSFIIIFKQRKIRSGKLRDFLSKNIKESGSTVFPEGSHYTVDVVWMGSRADIFFVSPQTKKRKTVIGLYVPINHARACRKLALPLQPVLYCGFFPFPTDSMLHTPGI
jgi:hypothetical protein